MNLYDKSSLVLIPSGIKDGKVYSQRPENGDGDFTFSRGSNLAATQVDVNGLIEKGRENLITYSNGFDQNTWNLYGAELTGGQQGYDGSNNAWKLYGTGIGGTTARLQKTITTSGLTNFSVYAKAAEWNYFGLYVFGQNKGVIWSLIDGTVQNNIVAYPEIYANGESVGNGWWKFSFSHVNTNTDIRYWACETNTYNGNSNDDSSGIYIQNAQAEVGLVATDYIESGSTTGKAGVLEDLPRLDYSGGASCLSLLLEPQRTNLNGQSEYLNGIGGGGLTKLENQTISPEGLQNAGSIEVTSISQPRLEFVSPNLNLIYTISCYVKRINADYIGFGYYQGDIGNNWCRFNIATGTFDAYDGAAFSDANIEDVGNGWYRISAVLTTASSGSKSGLKIAAMTQSSFQLSNIGNQYYVWGIQVEEANYATSYIPTYGAVTTRSADFSSNNDLVSTPMSFGTNDNFTFYYEGSFDSFTSGSNNMILGGGPAGTSRSYLWIYGTTIRMTGEAEVEMARATYSWSANTNYKILVKRNGSIIDFFINGVKLSSEQKTPNTIFTFSSLGWSYNNAVYKVSGNINQFAIFPTALTDSECIALTTL